MSEILGVKIRHLRPGATTPRYATEGSAACDLTAAIDAPVIIPCGGSASIPTGIAISMERKDVVAVVCARSGLAFKHGLSLVNGSGVIDSDYRGEICVGLRNHGTVDYTVQPGERIAQLMFMPCLCADFTVVDTLDDTERGQGGFVSTGKM